MRELRELFFPLRARIIKSNPYGLPEGKVFAARKKEGNASPFPIEICGDRVYQMAEDEVEIFE